MAVGVGVEPSLQLPLASGVEPSAQIPLSFWPLSVGPLAFEPSAQIPIAFDVEPSLQLPGNITANARCLLPVTKAAADSVDISVSTRNTKIIFLVG